MGRNQIKTPSKAAITPEITGQLTKRTNVNRSKKFRAGISARRYKDKDEAGSVPCNGTVNKKGSKLKGAREEGSEFVELNTLLSAGLVLVVKCFCL